MLVVVGGGGCCCCWWWLVVVAMDSPRSFESCKPAVLGTEWQMHGFREPFCKLPQCCGSMSVGLGVLCSKERAVALNVNTWRTVQQGEGGCVECRQKWNVCCCTHAEVSNSIDVEVARWHGIAVQRNSRKQQQRTRSSKTARVDATQ
jgi:hypothetical protein